MADPFKLKYDIEAVYRLYKESQAKLSRIDAIIREVPAEIENCEKEKLRFQKKGTARALAIAEDIEELIKFLADALDRARQARPMIELNHKISEQVFSGERVFE